MEIVIDNFKTAHGSIFVFRYKYELPGRPKGHTLQLGKNGFPVLIPVGDVMWRPAPQNPYRRVGPDAKESRKRVSRLRIMATDGSTISRVEAPRHTDDWESWEEHAWFAVQGENGLIRDTTVFGETINGEWMNGQHINDLALEQDCITYCDPLGVSKLYPFTWVFNYATGELIRENPEPQLFDAAEKLLDELIPGVSDIE